MRSSSRMVPRMTVGSRPLAADAPPTRTLRPRERKRVAGAADAVLREGVAAADVSRLELNCRRTCCFSKTGRSKFQAERHTFQLPSACSTRQPGRIRMRIFRSQTFLAGRLKTPAPPALQRYTVASKTNRLDLH